jgi:polysaccharide export outer membrane protein
MKLSDMTVPIFGGALFFALLMLTSASAAEPPPKELHAYIAEAQKLGVADDAIRQNALRAGWDGSLIDEAFAALKQTETAGGAELPEGYRIGAGDVLQISVWKEPDASVPDIAVRADGKITLPLVKEVHVAGLTPAGLEKLLMERLGRFIHGVDVTVIVRETNSWRVYLVGAVRAVGPIPLKSRLTVLQALTLAGGLTDYAKRKQIYILRNEDGRQVRLAFNYEAVIRGEQMEQNIVLQPDDTIVVPQ